MPHSAKHTCNSIDEQTRLWAEEGISAHNLDRDECCPDFSCCNESINTPMETRKKFLEAERSGNEELVSQMLGMFLGGVINTHFPDKDVHIVGDSPTEGEVH